MKNEAEKALERVRKMLALARNAGASEGERDNALRMAHATLTKYNLSMADAEAGGEQKEESRNHDEQEILAWPWMRHVQYAVAKLFFCAYYYSKLQRKNHTIGTFVGRESNVITAKSISEYVIESIVKEANAHRKAGGDWLSFCKGASGRIVERCTDLQSASEAESAKEAAAAAASKEPGTAIVLASFYQNEEIANKQYIASMSVTVTVAKPRKLRKSKADDYLAGRRHGDKISLNSQIEGKKNDDLLPY